MLDYVIGFMVVLRGKDHPVTKFIHMLWKHRILHKTSLQITIVLSMSVDRPDFESLSYHVLRIEKLFNVIASIIPSTQ